MYWIVWSDGIAVPNWQSRSYAIECAETAVSLGAKAYYTIMTNKQYEEYLALNTLKP